MMPTVKPDYLVFAVPMRNIRKTIQLLKPYESQFNRLSVTGVTKYHYTDEILKAVNTVAACISEYFKWKNSTEVDSETTRDRIKEMFNVAGTVNEVSGDVGCDDPRKLLHLDDLDKKFIPQMTNIWFSLHCRNDQSGNDMPLGVYQMMLAKLMWNVVSTLGEACRVFNVKDALEKFVFLGYEIHIGFDPACERVDGEYVPVFTLHDEVVAFSPEEIEAQKRRDEEAKRQAEEAKRIEDARQAVLANIATVLKCYNKHKEMGNLPKFSLTQEGIDILSNPSTIEKCNSCRSLYRLLMAMSESIRYMPGDTGSDEDRIMGSFMELENDVLSYHQRFTIYMHSYGLEHSDIYVALKFFNTENGTVKAQYVESKEYIDAPAPDDPSPKTVHLFAE